MSHNKHHEPEHTRPSVEQLLERLVEIAEQDQLIAEHNTHILRKIERDIARLVPQLTLPTAITFQETTMLSPVAGNTLVYTGSLVPAGSSYPADAAFALVSSDPTVTPTVDPTGLIVTIPLPSTFVDPPAAPFNVGYTATSASNPTWSVTAVITPSVPTTLPTGINFVQTT
jgi:hypothetical protein